MSEALEIRIEEAWMQLIRMAPSRSRCVYLTKSRLLIWGERATRQIHLIEVGTYNREITLVDFREDVFFANDKMREAA